MTYTFTQNRQKKLWKTMPLIEAVRIANGQVDPRIEPYSSMILVAPDHIESGTGRLIEKKTAADQEAISGKYLFKAGDIVYSKIRPKLRKAIIVDFDGLCSADMYPLTPANGVSSAFIFALLLGEDFSKYVESVSMRSGIPKINRDELAEYAISLPPLSEQNRIVAILETWDKAIERLERKITLKKGLKVALMESILFGTKRLPGFKNTWNTFALGSLFQERKETNCIDLPLLSITSNEGVILQSDSNKKDTSNKDKSKYKKICRGDIGYNTMRMWQGRCALSELEGIVSPAYTIVIPNKNTNSRYFSYLFKTPRLAHLFLQHSQGLVSDTLNCKFKDFAKVRCKIPDFEEQTAIANILEVADREIAALTTELYLIKEQKGFLLNNLVTGNIRTPENMPISKS